jgi:predicted Zn-dependent protease
MRRSVFRALVLALPLAASTGACAYSNSAITGARRYYGYSWQQELAIGRQVNGDLSGAYGVYGDSALGAYVARVGDTIVATSHLRRPTTPPEMRGAPFTFRVLDSDVVNAFAVPGGYVYVTRGLLAHLDNEAQLAVILGHEVGHVAARHTSQRALTLQIGMLGAVAAAVLADRAAEGSGEGVSDLASGLLGLAMLSYGRGDERESDRLGVEYAALAGYRADEGARFFELLEMMRGQEKRRTPEFLSSHPNPGSREATVRELAAGDSVFRGAIDGMVIGRDPRRGYAEGGVFHHPEGGFAFDLPAGWTTEWSGARFGAENGSKKAALVFLAAPGDSTAVEAANRWVARSSSAYRDTTMAAPEGFAAASARGSWIVGEEEGWISTTFVEARGRVYQLMGMAQPGHRVEMDSALAAAIRGFRADTDPRAASVQPMRLRFVTVEIDAPFRTFVSGPLPDGLALEDLAMMNRVLPDDVVPAGTALKLPQWALPSREPIGPLLPVVPAIRSRPRMRRLPRRMPSAREPFRSRGKRKSLVRVPNPDDP